MYYQYFGLSEAPFSIAVNPRYLFMSARHRDALAHLLYGVGAGGGFILLTGEVGTGKTTINRCLLEQLPENTDIAIILNPALNAIELLASVCDELGIEYQRDGHTLKTLTDSLHRFLLDNHARGRKTVLMIDEAQHLDFDVLEQIRLLTNLETHSEKLLQIILIGQPELAQLLARPELRQLNQRITARYNLGPLNLNETRAYIQHRLQVAGMTADRELFPAAVVRGIYRETRGIPRLINVLCDRILLGTYGRNKRRADTQTLRLAVREVLGEERAETPARWPWVLAGLSLLAILAGGASLWAWRSGLPPFAAAPALVAAPPMVTQPEPAAVEQSIVEQPAARPPRPAAALPAVQAVAPVAESSAWLLPPEDGATNLWRLFSARPVPVDLCDDPVGELACIEGRARTWNEVAVLDRPLLLDAVTPERFAAGVLLLGIDGRTAWVLGQGQDLEERTLLRVPLAEIAPYWSGDYRFLWHPPAGYERPLALGDSGPAVAAVAALFARLDGRERALAGEQFNAALQQRVKLFQAANNLEADGVVGVRTLLELNRALGLDPGAEAARLALSGEQSLATGAGG
ncbi:general secretion pathway protein GspA [Mangrovimicrobium sediminis]|uniref:General secretion pathway protein GspA n=1 Tax=Mangrovimicrobium sediminis TaxID=2562682 RepID=A0A4Z0LXD9_9GAMM|nr:AAA family ATPase [Haliea sp. SAOS-164]TGD71894.1 general secretion pathway protein GspA [Haliea sp. SAOS-164]